MKYCSTRSDQYKGLAFEDALFKGFLDDGGTLLPEKIPTLTEDQLKSWSNLSYPDVVKKISSLFIDEEELPRDTLNGLIDKAFERFNHPEITPITTLRDGAQIFELFHGQTMAFKDLSLSCIGQMLEYFLNKRKKNVIALVGTSGDTGSAAIEGVRGLKSVDIIVILPKGRCSRIQELQMTTVIEDNVHVYRLDGSSDDLDVPIVGCFMDGEFVEKYGLFSINSINWVRVMIQISHYVYAYLKANKNNQFDVEIVVPSGGCGNSTAGCIAKMMGVPIKLVTAVNTNDFVDRFIKSGKLVNAGHATPTVAPSMDIQFPYNVPRWINLFSNRDHILVNKIFSEFEANGEVTIPNDLMEKIRGTVSSYSCDDDEIKRTIKRCWDENKYVLCPHTAVGMAYHYHQLSLGVDQPNLARICIATASPVKFPEVVEEAGVPVPQIEQIQSLLEKPTRYIDMEKGQDWEQILRKKVIEIHETRLKQKD